MRALAAIVLALVLASAAAADTGRDLYAENCSRCHGSAGEGTNDGPSLRDVGALAADFYLRTGYMPLRQVGVQPRRTRVLFDERQIEDLVAYVAALGHGPPVPTPRPERGSLSEGQRLFTDHCAGCHQVVAEGGYLKGGIAPPLEDAPATQGVQAIRIGPYVMPRFSTRDLSPQQVDSIVRYVVWSKHPDDRGGWGIGHVGPVPEGLVTWFLGAVVLVATCVALGTRLRRE